MTIRASMTLTETGFIVEYIHLLIEVTAIQNNAVKVVSKPKNSQIIEQEQTRHAINEEKCHWAVCKLNSNDGIKVGNLSVIFDGERLKFFNKKQLILSEFAKQQTVVKRTIGIDDNVPILPKESSSLNITAHYFRQIEQSHYHAQLRFESDSSEFICGLGGYQEKALNKNGGQYELQQRNSQTTIPIYLSHKNYGFIWNNAGIGKVTFSKNHYLWEAYYTQTIEYIVFVGDNIKDLMRKQGQLVGYAPKMPERYLGLWQSKLRYQTTKELKTVYDNYLLKGITPCVLVIDYFHWLSEGSFEFDSRYWNGIEHFAKDCQKTQTDIMVSVWPTVTPDCAYWQHYKDNNMLIHDNNQIPVKLFNQAAILDFSNAKTREDIRNKLAKNYIEKGITLFWADQAEPEMTNYQHQMLYTKQGNLSKIGNRFPVLYLQTMPNHNQNDDYLPTLIRSVWLGSQSQGALAWSGDIVSSFDALFNQIQIAKSMGLSGQAWWTSDTGGFHAYTSDKDYNVELMIRWFQFSTFSPILRMHGDRQPHNKPLGNDGGGIRTSGFENEIWSFGEIAETIMINYIHLREKLKPYIIQLFHACHETGYPLIRPLFFEYPKDNKTWCEETAYFFGCDMLVVPVTNYKQRCVKVYIPKGDIWTHLFTKQDYIGGKTYSVDAPLENIPVFIKKDSALFQRIDELLSDWRT